MGGGASIDKGLGADEIIPKPFEGTSTSDEPLVNADKRSRGEANSDSSFHDKILNVNLTAGRKSAILPDQQKSPSIEQTGNLPGRRDQKLPALPYNENHDLLRVPTAAKSVLQEDNPEKFRKKSASMASPRYLTPVLRIPPSSSFSDAPIAEDRPLAGYQFTPLSDSATANRIMPDRLELASPSDVPSGLIGTSSVLDARERSIPLSSEFRSGAMRTSADAVAAIAQQSVTKGFEYQQNPQSSFIGSPPTGPKPSSSSKSSSKRGHGHNTSEGRTHSSSRGRPRSNTAPLVSEYSLSHTGKSSKSSHVVPRPPGSSRSRQSSADGGRSVAARSYPSEFGMRGSRSIDEFDDLDTSFMESFKEEVMSPKRSIVPPLLLNVNNVTKDAVSPSFSRVIGMGLAPQGLRINTAAPCSEAAAVTPLTSSSALNYKSSGQTAQLSTNSSDRPLNHTPNSSNSGTRPTPTSMGASLYEVKETNDVKRNRAKLPPTMIHAKPTTGDWLKKRYIVNNYILLDTLGTGSYGEVRLCKDRTTDNLFAIKIISKEMLKKRKSGNTTETYFEDIRREIAIMKKLLHPNVLRLYEVLDDPNVNKMYLVLEYMKKGDLINVLKDRENTSSGGGSNPKSAGAGGAYTILSDLELWNIFRQIVAGVRYLHYQNVVHGDIKPQNLLVGENGIVKIADFGISKMLSNSDEQLGNAAGTPAFMSPELCAAQAFSGQLADIWALGATVFMLKYGHPPFVAGNLLNLYNKIQNDPLVFPSHTKINPSLQDLLENMLRKDPNERYTLDKVVLHPWIRHPPPNPATTTALPAAATASNDKPDSTVMPVNAKPRQRVSPQNNTDESTVPIPVRAQFCPPDSYNDEEAAAMEKPVKEVNMEDMYKSISVSVVGKSKSHRAKSKNSTATPTAESEKMSSTNSADNEKDKDKDKGIDEDMMRSGWGADVFEIVHVGEEINSDSDDDSDDADDVIAETTVAPSSMDCCDTRVDVLEISNTARPTGVDNEAVVTNIAESEKRLCAGSGNDGGKMEVEGEWSKPDDKRHDRLGAHQSAEYPALSTVSTVSEDPTQRRVMDADEEILRSSRFRSQLSKRSIKEALVRELRSKKNSVEGNHRSSKAYSPSSNTGPYVARSSCTEGSGTADTHLSGARSTYSKASTPDRGRSRDIDEYAECTGELSIEEFRNMMDTLTTKSKSKEKAVDGGTLDPVNLTLDTVNFSSQLMNVHNGIGVAYHSEKGQREFQEDRCCLVPNVAETLLQATLDSGAKTGTGAGVAGGSGTGSRSRSRRGSFLSASHADRDDHLRRISIVCLFDGHSGCGCSEFLSKTFVNMLVHHEMFLDDSPEAALVDVCRVIDGQVCDQLVEDDDLSGSTGVIAVYDGLRDMLTVANVGDSMCVLSKGGKAVNMHRMHRLDDAEERARVEAAGGTIIKNRVNGVLAVSRAFGDTQFKDTNSWRTDQEHNGSPKGPVIAVPDVCSNLCSPHTEFCIMATDGLWDVMSPQSAVNFVRTKLSEKCNLQVCAEGLVRDAVTNGGSVDNVTVVILSFRTLTVSHMS